MKEQLSLLPELLTAHLQLTLVALLVACSVSIPIGVVATRVPWLRQGALGVAGVIQTIPGLALLAVMVPLLTALSLQGIGFLPAIIGLTLYCVLPILMATVTGIGEVDPAMIEAARGVGMTRAERLRLVELPLALPVIVSGLRTATVWCVGMATLSTPVGAPSLGNYIFGGLQTRNYASVLVGCVAAALLAQLLDRIVQTIEVGIRRRRRTLVLLPASVLAALFLFAGTTLAADVWSSSSGERVVIGAKTFTEQYILSEAMALVVHSETGLPTELMQSLGSTVAFDALEAGDIDLYVDYSGTIWATIMEREEVPNDRAEVLRAVGEYLAEERGVVLVASVGFENTYALAMRDQHAQSLGVERISQLTRHASRLSIGGDYEFFGRKEWVAIQDRYGLVFEENRAMDASLMYQAVDSENVDVISAYSTDGRIAALDLRVLDDDRGAIPPYDAIILASARLARERPEVIDALSVFDGAIDADHMRRLNMAVDGDGRAAAAVAAELAEALSSAR